jgi:nucleotide-binding universal stress UspA family protein
LKQQIFLKMAVIEMTPQIRKVGVALTTMHARSLLAEASRFAERLGVPLALIHATTGEAESQAHLREAVNQLTIPVEKHIIWNKSESAQALLMSAAEQADIELLVAGAFEGPALNRRRFLSSAARKMVDSARCSLLLLVQPRIDTNNFRRLVVLTDFSEVSKIACEQALWLAEKDAVECVHVISIHTIFMDARARTGAKDGKPARTRVQEEQLMEDFLASLPKCQVQVDWSIVDATTGFAACEFAESVEADLLVLPGYNRPQGRVPPLADWALQVVPCSLWIVQDRAAYGNPSSQ